MLKPIIAQWEKSEDFNFYLSILSHQFNFVYKHSERVAGYGVMLAKQLGLTDEEVSAVGAAALLHDIGKINVPIKVLYKQGTYDQYDRAEMERHPVYGSQMLLRSKDLRELTAGVLHHHERYDGTGYPKKLQKEEIPLAARIIHIAEAYDVMTTVQNYQHWKKRDEALAELKCKAGSQFDARLVEAFLCLQPDIISKITPSANSIAGASETQAVVLPDSVIHYMANISNLGIVCLDKNNTVVFCNSYAEQMRQLPAGALFGKNFLENYPAHRRTILEEKLLQLQSGEQTEWYRLMGRNGRFIENRYSRVTDGQGNFIGTVLVTIDVTEREQLTRSLNSALERQSALYQAAQVITSTLNIAEITESMLKIISKSMVVNQAGIYLVADNEDAVTAVYPGNPADACSGDCGWVIPVLRSTLKTLVISNDGDLYQYYIPLLFRNALLGILYVDKICRGEDNTERLALLEALAGQIAVAIHNTRLQEEILYLAEYDKLTGLFNRHSFDRLFADYCRRAGEKMQPLTLLMIDINGLKAVNDRQGHMAGDLLIKETARIIQCSIRADDCAFRYGGDEIVVLMPDMSLAGARIVIKRIQHTIKTWKAAGEHGELALSVSIGAADSSEVAAGGLIQEADKRMYANKRKYYKLIKA